MIRNAFSTNKFIAAIAILSIYYNYIFCHMLKRDGKLVLKPQQLVKLILEEQLQRVGPSTCSPRRLSARNVSFVETRKARNSGEVEVPLEKRKVWSRWSKWGPCSVTCGVGMIIRKRRCVIGRCARGELEEQRRKCTRSPCKVPSNDVTLADEVHDVDDA